MGALDAAFWDLEDEHTPLHIGGVAVFEGPAPAPEEMAAVYEGGIATDPRYRRRMRRTLYGLGRPAWVEDCRYDPRFHLRRTALVSPGGEPELNRLVGRIMSVRMDPDRPPWEAWVIEGLADDKWAVLIKLHHSIVDGLAAVDLFSAMLDPSLDRPLPRPARSAAAGGMAHRAGEATATVVRVVGDVVALGRRPGEAVRTVGDTVVGALGFARSLRPTTEHSLTGPVGSPRRYRTLTVDLGEVGDVRAAFGGSVNDVVLALVTRGFRELLLARGEEPGHRSIRCLVPVSTRAGNPLDVGNAVSALFAELPVDVPDAVDAYLAVRAMMGDLKASHEADAGRRGLALAELIPAPVATIALRVLRRLPQHFLTTVATNVPGPQQPVRMLGRRMIALYPYVPIADRLRIGVAVTSYDGRLHFGVTADRDSTPDLDVLVAAMTDGMAELLKEAANLSGDQGA